MSELAFGQILATFSWAMLFEKYQKFTENARFQQDFKVRLKTMENGWPSGQIWSKDNTFGQNMSLWPEVGVILRQKVPWPRFGHFYIQENHKKSKNSFKFIHVWLLAKNVFLAHATSTILSPMCMNWKLFSLYFLFLYVKLAKSWPKSFFEMVWSQLLAKGTCFGQKHYFSSTFVHLARAFASTIGTIYSMWNLSFHMKI